MPGFEHMQGNAKATLQAAGFVFENRGFAGINYHHTTFSHDGKFTITNDDCCRLAYPDPNSVRIIKGRA